jgi:hypothetical protein
MRGCKALVPRRVAQKIGPVHRGMKDVVVPGAVEPDIEMRCMLKSSLILSLGPRAKGRQYEDRKVGVLQVGATEPFSALAPRENLHISAGEPPCVVDLKPKEESYATFSIKAVIATQEYP